jgi:hypothetical protein
MMDDCKVKKQGWAYGLHHGTKFSAEGRQLGQSLLQDCREAEEAKSMACRGCVEDNHRVLHRFHVPETRVHRKKSFRESINGAGTHFIISANPIASSTPGIEKARSCSIEPICPLSSAHEGQVSKLYLSRQVHQTSLASTISCIEADGSISIA